MVELWDNKSQLLSIVAVAEEVGEHEIVRGGSKLSDGGSNVPLSPQTKYGRWSMASFILQIIPL